MVQMDIISWLTESASVNRHVSPLYFIIVSIIALSVLYYALSTTADHTIGELLQEKTFNDEEIKV